MGLFINPFGKEHKRKIEGIQQISIIEKITKIIELKDSQIKKVEYPKLSTEDKEVGFLNNKKFVLEDNFFDWILKSDIKGGKLSLCFLKIDANEKDIEYLLNKSFYILGIDSFDKGDFTISDINIHKGISENSNYRFWFETKTENCISIQKLNEKSLTFSIHEENIENGLIRKHFKEIIDFNEENLPKSKSLIEKLKDINIDYHNLDYDNSNKIDLSFEEKKTGILSISNYKLKDNYFNSFMFSEFNDGKHDLHFVKNNISGIEVGDFISKVVDVLGPDEFNRNYLKITDCNNLIKGIEEQRYNRYWTENGNYIFISVSNEGTNFDLNLVIREIFKNISELPNS